MKDIFLRRDTAFEGEYRFVYWGITTTESVVATQFSVEWDQDG